MAAPAFILLVLAVGLGPLASQRSLWLDRKGLGALGSLVGWGKAAAQLESRGGAALGSSPPPGAPTLLQLAFCLHPTGPPWASWAWLSPSHSAVGQGQAPPPHLRLPHPASEGLCRAGVQLIRAGFSGFQSLCKCTLCRVAGVTLLVPVGSHCPCAIPLSLSCQNWGSRGVWSCLRAE